MARNRPIKILWYGSETDDEGNPIIPKISPSFEKRLEGLNEGEIYIHNDDKNPSIYIRTNKDRVVAISGGVNISELAKYFLRKDKEDSTNFLLSLLGGTVIKKYAKFGDFVTGVDGGFINEKGDIEMGSGVFRKRLFVPEIAYNRTTYFKGRMVNSPGGGCTVLSYVDNGDGTYTITPDLTDADGLSQFVDDILTTYFVTKNSEGKLNGFEEMKFRVTAADYTAKKFTVIPRPGILTGNLPSRWYWHKQVTLRIRNVRLIYLLIPSTETTVLHSLTMPTLGTRSRHRCLRGSARKKA